MRYLLIYKIIKAIFGIRQTHFNGTAPFNLIHLPDDKVIQFSRLDTNLTEADAAIVSVADIIWSPDGRYFAFSAALNGSQHADLYLDQPERGGFNRESSLSHNAYPLVWTPDSRQVVFAEIDASGKNGWVVDSIWLAGPDQPARKLYDPRSSRMETVIGFPGVGQMLVCSEDVLGKFNLRQVDLSTGKSKTIQMGTFTSAAFDPKSQIADYTDHSFGLYEVKLPDGQPREIKRGSWNQVTWLPWIGQFLVSGTDRDGTLLVTPDGTVSQFDQESCLVCTPQVSPDGGMIAFYGLAGELSGVRLYRLDGIHLPAVTEVPAYGVSFRPDSGGLFFISSNILYYLNSMSIGPQPITAVDPSAFVNWVH